MLTRGRKGLFYWRLHLQALAKMENEDMPIEKPEVVMIPIEEITPND